MAKILVIGHCFLDIKGIAPKNYSPRERNAGKIFTAHGGVSRNIVVNVAHTGMNVCFATLLEDNAFGHDYETALRRAGAEVCARTVRENGIGKWMVILSDSTGGETVGQISSMPSAEELENLLLEKGDELVRDADAVVAEFDVSRRLAEISCELAKKYNKPLFTTVSTLENIVNERDLLPNLECFICNDKEFARLTGAKTVDVSPKKALAELKAHLAEIGSPSAVVTLGKNGSAYCDTRTGESGVCPVTPVPVADSTGAGDSFLSAVIMAKTLGMSLTEAVKKGTALAAATIQTTESACPVNLKFWLE